MKVWITKYALTTGIEEVEAEVTESRGSMIQVTGRQFGTYYHKPFWHTSREEAVAHAELLRAKKLKSLRKAIAKLESLQF